jgi:hypothetical protein
MENNALDILKEFNAAIDNNADFSELIEYINKMKQTDSAFVSLMTNVLFEYVNENEDEEE